MIGEHILRGWRAYNGGVASFPPSQRNVRLAAISFDIAGNRYFVNEAPTKLTPQKAGVAICAEMTRGSESACQGDMK